MLSSRRLSRRRRRPSFGASAFLRLLRLVVVGGHDGVAAFLRTIWTAADALGLLLFVMCVGLLAFSSAVFYCEQGTWDEATGEFVRPGLFGDLERTPFISSKRGGKCEALCLHPQQFLHSPNAVPHSMWWATVTITTIGYGDMIPSTACGRVVTSALLVTNIIVLALPSA